MSSFPCGPWAGVDLTWSLNVIARARKLLNRFGVDVDLFMLMILAAIILTGWLVAELADEVLEGSTQRYDEWVLRHLRTPGDMTDPIGPRWFKDMWRDITALGSSTILTLVTAACAGYLLMRKQHRILILLLAATIGGSIVSLVLKTAVDRPRPEFASPESYVATASFPSGHSMLSAVVYLTLGALLARTTNQYRYKIYYLTTAALITLLVGLSRVYLGVHYPTDVLAGWSVGLLWALFCWLVAYVLQKRGAIEHPRETA